ncbi:hypothetical protein N8556_00445 [bacterium]|nr:hypothetical protein [bacterium]
MNDDFSDRPATPPVLPADDLEARSVRWPTVIGVISLVYGILALIGNGCGAASPFATPFFLQMSGMDAEKLTMSPTLVWVQVGSGAIGMAIAILLLTGSVGLLRRSTRSLGLLKAWVAIAIVTTIIGIGLGFVFLDANVQYQLDIQDATKAMIKDRGGDASQFPAKTAEEIKSQSRIMLAVFGLLPMVYPVILGFLITSKSRSEQAMAWDE